MTTAHRATYKSAKATYNGVEQGNYSTFGTGTNAVAARDMPGQGTLKRRLDGQGTEEEINKLDLKAQLEKSEAEHRSKRAKLVAQYDDSDDDASDDAAMDQGGAAATGAAATAAVASATDQFLAYRSCVFSTPVNVRSATTTASSAPQKIICRTSSNASGLACTTAVEPYHATAWLELQSSRAPGASCE